MNRFEGRLAANIGKLEFIVCFVLDFLDRICYYKIVVFLVLLAYTWAFGIETTSPNQHIRSHLCSLCCIFHWQKILVPPNQQNFLGAGENEGV